MSGITLTNAVRSNLNTLTATADMMSDVQNKLATGKKVNSALDNPNSFFTAKGLENRASDLGTLLDDMSQGVQTLQAADDGITAISDLVDAAKAKANQALQTSDQSLRAQYASEYNDLLGQMEDLAKDSEYKGKNLLGGTGNDLSVTFNEDGSSSMSISAVDLTDAEDGLGLKDIAAGTDGTASFKVGSTTATNNAKLELGTNFTAGDTITITDSNGTELGSFEVTSDTTVGEFADFVDDLDDVSASYATGSLSVTGEGMEIEVSSSDISVGTSGSLATAGTDGGFGTDDEIEAALSALSSAQDTLRAQASSFGTTLSVVENRQDFTESMINTLMEGAGELTLADTNTEGANLLALQTQQQLASTSLSMASQASQNVLQLF